MGKRFQGNRLASGAATVDTGVSVTGATVTETRVPSSAVSS